MDNRLAVKLTGPAKVDGKWKPVGETVFVSPLVAAQLAEAGAIPPVNAIDEAVAAVNAENADFEQSVAVKAKEIAESLVAAAVSATVEELVTERDQAIRRVEAAEARVTFLEGQLAEINKSAKPKPTVKKTADKKPAPKKNATGG